ncbi:trypsin-like peptidase domain-containing protein [Streptomyces sp. NPDC051976]|uniref:trypsin-like peptidase domain-containing protein n=1 Tax=Streptomyces sp. NPDC051976 TaxID=3154947 RepID=UPI00341E9C26
MGPHQHRDKPWRVRVDHADGTTCGAGVLLDDRHVLTCAHVVRNAEAAPQFGPEPLRITSVACHPEWSGTARLAPGSWMQKDGTQRGDVALLRLDAPADCGTRTTLWRVPLSGGEVSAYGFPEASRRIGMGTDAELAGSGGREGEWGLLHRVREGGPWIEPGYSGAGVAVKEGEFKDRVIGIVVADFVDGGARAAWMLPTETIQAYLPQIAPYIGGGRTSDLPDDPWPDDVLGDSLRLALTQELTRLLGGKWAGTVVLGTGGATGAGASWLARLVRTADPAARAGLSDAELTGAPGDTVLGVGAIDAAFDVRGKRAEDLRRYLVARFGLPGGTDTEVVHQLLRRRPPACVVVGSVDLADDPEALVRGLLKPLATRARSRGVRLALGFEGPPPDDLAYDVSLYTEPLAASVPGRVTAREAEAAVERLAVKEEEAALLQAEWGPMFFGAPRPPSAAAPRLRVRLAVARGAAPESAPDPELAVIHAQACTAHDEAGRFTGALAKMRTEFEDRSSSLEVHRVRSARYFGDEDRPLGELYAAAVRTLRSPPVDLTAARRRVRRYTDEVNRRIEEASGHAGG